MKLRGAASGGLPQGDTEEKPELKRFFKGRDRLNVKNTTIRSAEWSQGTNLDICTNNVSVFSKHAATPPNNKI